ncbi:Holliday junction resolvase RuvX [Gammaproteobacteria bacterium]|nr:Holliday junction resolvase RuvX [Gammaproteobacteria bacterium]
MPNPTGFIIAVDFGLTYIGLAVGQTVTNSATGIATLRAKSGKPNWKELADIVAEFSPSLLLVGLPLNMDGTESEMSKKAEIFARKLEQKTKTPTSLVDERLSSKEAIEIANRGRKKAHHDGSVHEISACLIAQTWLNENKY